MTETELQVSLSHMSIPVEKYRKWVNAWLCIGVVMVLFQIMLGGITRLTGSGLSITKWDIVTGTIPPLSAADWENEFMLYKETPQYQKINEGMTLRHFKFIYFWEYVHRLWARTMGFVFLIPFLFFLSRGALKKATIRRLMVVVGLAALAALFGWIMVASGLVNRPWVNAYKLTVHLGLGITLFVYLSYTWWKELSLSPVSVPVDWIRKVNILTILVVIQICFGGFVSGMKAALNYPTWPTMNGEWIPDIIMDSSHWNMDAVLLYDQSGFMPAFVQFIHRGIAYLIFILIVVYAVRWIKTSKSTLHWIGYGLMGLVMVQVLLGIFTILKSKGEIPVSFGALHQMVGILLLTFLIFIRFRFKNEDPLVEQG